MLPIFRCQNSCFEILFVIYKNLFTHSPCHINSIAKSTCFVKSPVSSWWVSRRSGINFNFRIYFVIEHRNITSKEKLISPFESPFNFLRELIIKHLQCRYGFRKIQKTGLRKNCDQLAEKVPYASIFTFFLTSLTFSWQSENSNSNLSLPKLVREHFKNKMAAS